MTKFIVLIYLYKGKTAKNELKNDDSDFLWTLYGYIQNLNNFFPQWLVELFKERFISSVKSYKYLSKLISSKTMVLIFLKILFICAQSF